MSSHHVKVTGFVLLAELLGNASSCASVDQRQRGFLISLDTKGVTELEALPGYPEVFSRALNDMGQIAGFAMGGGMIPDMIPHAVKSPLALPEVI